jgi:hypothetical protein
MDGVRASSKLYFDIRSSTDCSRGTATCVELGNRIVFWCLYTDIRKWRLFGSESEERAFGVLAMTWWEGRVPDINSDEVALEHESDDFLLAVMQSINGRQYLSCWSPKRYV